MVVDYFQPILFYANKQIVSSVAKLGHVASNTSDSGSQSLGEIVVTGIFAIIFFAVAFGILNLFMKLFESK